MHPNVTRKMMNDKKSPLNFDFIIFGQKINSSMSQLVVDESCFTKSNLMLFKLLACTTSRVVDCI